MAGRDDRGDRRATGGNHQEQRSARDGFLPNRELLMTPALTIDAPPYDVCGAATPTPPQPPPVLRRSDTKDAASVAAKPHSRRGHYRHDESLQEGARSVAGGGGRIEGGGGHAPTARGRGNVAASVNRARRTRGTHARRPERLGHRRGVVVSCTCQPRWDNFSMTSRDCDTFVSQSLSKSSF